MKLIVDWFMPKPDAEARFVKACNEMLRAHEEMFPRWEKLEFSKVVGPKGTDVRMFVTPPYRTEIPSNDD